VTSPPSPVPLGAGSAGEAGSAERPEVQEFVAFLAKERNDSPNTVAAYRRDLRLFAEFCDQYSGTPWNWGQLDRVAIRSFMGELQRRGLEKRSVARAVSALRTFYNFLMARHGLENNPAKAVRTPRLEKRLPAVRRVPENLSATPDARR